MLICAVLMGEAAGLDLEEIIEAKLVVNARNYPVARAYGRKGK